MRRRRFLQSLAALAISPSVLSQRAKRIGIQLYALRDDARRNLERTLAAIAEIGYTDVELLGSLSNFGAPPRELRAMLDRLRLRAPSTHVSGAALDDLPRQLDDARTLGHEYLIVAGLPAADMKSLDGYRRWADRLNVAGAEARKAGVWVGFHNHAGDFVTFGGRVAYDELVERTDPAVVRMQLDTGNLAMAGRDPLAYVERYGARYWSYHVKDVPAMGASRDVELGAGVVDFRRLLARIHHRDEALLFVEQENYPGAPIDSARRNHAYLAKLLG